MAGFWHIIKSHTTLDRMPPNGCKRDRTTSPTNEILGIVNAHSGQITALEVYNKYNEKASKKKTIADVIYHLNYLTSRGKITRVFGEVFKKVEA